MFGCDLLLWVWLGSLALSLSCIFRPFGLKFRSFRFDQRGNVSVVFGVAALVLFGAVAAAVETAMLIREKSVLQSVADAAVLAGARELSLAKDEQHVKTVMDNIASIKIKTITEDKAIQETPVITSTVDTATSRVTVSITQKRISVFSGVLPSTGNTISVNSSAKLANGNNKICVLALDSSSSGALSLTGAAAITANGCMVQSNSVSSTGLSSYKDSLLKAKLICSSGGFGGDGNNFSPSPVTDCPSIPDPLRSRIPPPFSTCDYNKFEVSGATETLTPGTYCGGLLITNGANVTFEPGEYIIKDGSFEVTHTSKVFGKYVGFYLTGTGTRFLFAAGTNVELHAPKTGPMAGLLFFEDRDMATSEVHNIISDNARILVGTFYLPRGTLQLNSKKPIADMSAYTAVIANKINLNRYPTIVLNANYQNTDVPVPGGLNASIGRAVQLDK